MEEIALMALPRSTEENSDEGSVSTDQASLGLAAGSAVDWSAVDLPLDGAWPEHHMFHSNEDDIEDKGKEVMRCICGNQELPPKAGPGWLVQCED